MIIGGPCLYAFESDKEDIIETAHCLTGYIDMFRCKLFGGGTNPSKYFEGVGLRGIETLKRIRRECRLPIGTEVQSLGQIKECQLSELDFVWIGARNSQNYMLLSHVAEYFSGDIYIKRGPCMTIEELYGVYDIMKQVHYRNVTFIERGVVTFDRSAEYRWTPDLRGCLRIKHERPEIPLVIDVSHSSGKKEYITPIYRAFEASGFDNYMFEVTHNGKSHTDQAHMLSAKEFIKIIGEKNDS